MNVAIPLAMFGLMAVIGTELSIDDFKRFIRYPTAVIGGSLGQIILLPLLAALITLSLDLSDTETIALFIFSACPGGGLSNVLTSQGKGNVALSITLTAIGCLLGLVTIPIIMAIAFRVFIGESAMIDVPIAAMIGQLLLLVILPAVAGMTVRTKKPLWVALNQKLLNRISAFLLFLIIIFSLLADNGLTAEAILDGVTVGFLFSLGALLAGFITSKLIRLNQQDQIALVIEFVVRNGAIAALITLVIMQRPDLMAIPSACVMMQLILALLIVASIRVKEKKQHSQ